MDSIGIGSYTPSMADGPQRKLTAIVIIDVVGYSRLMGADEPGTLARLKEHRAATDPLYLKHGGRIVGTSGDGLLLEFPSVVEAVSSAIEVQNLMAERNADRPNDQKMLYRIGINLGDVMIDGDDIYGDGVNIAARLEALADAGGVSLSDDAYRQVRDRIDTPWENGGEHEVKNIARPIQIWRWDPDGTANKATARIADDHSVQPQPDKPSIAVLPFENMSGDPEQEFFADGMTEDIITGLSRFRSLYVTARNSTYSYKGTAPDIRDVANTLGVRYVLEGSVRRVGQRIRISAQLIEAESGHHIWAERFDRVLEDIFTVQDEVTEAIVAAIAPEVSEMERSRAQRKPLDDLDAWGRYQHGLAAYYSSTEKGLTSAIKLFDKVNDLDPTFAPAFAMAAGARWRHAVHFEPVDRSATLRQALNKAYKATELDPRDTMGLYHLSEVHSMLGQHDLAIQKATEAVGINPADAVARYFLGSVLRRAGRSAEAIQHFEQAMRLSPRDIWITGMRTDQAFVLFELGRFDEAYEWAQKARLSPNPRTMTYAVYAAVLVKLGRMDEAGSAVDDLLAHAPGLTYSKYRSAPFGTPEAMEPLAAALRDAGLPE